MSAIRRTPFRSAFVAVVIGLMSLVWVPAATAAAPQVFDGFESTTAGVPFTIFLSYDDADGDPLTFSVVTPPDHGTLGDCSGGSCLYTPTGDYVGDDSFTFKANDGTADSNIGTVFITIDPIAGVDNLQVAGSGSGAILTWTNPAGVDDIVVRYSSVETPLTTSDGTDAPVVGALETVTVSGLVTGTNYFFSVFVVDGGLTSGPASVQFTPFQCPDLTPALDAAPGLITGQSWPVCAAANAHEPASTLTTVLPKTGTTQAYLTSGDKSVAVPPSDGDGEGASTGTGSRGAFDVSIYKIDLNVPPTHTCLRFDYVFASDEYPEYINSAYNDGFLAQLDQNTWTVDESSNIIATDNFARLGDGSFISVTSAVFKDAAKVTTSPANGTGYDGMSVPLTATTPITSGPHSIYLSIFDAGDSILDSAAFIDNLRTSTGTCTAGSNQAPNAVDDVATTAEDTPVEVTVLSNDTEPDNQTLTVIGKTDGTHGSVTCTTLTCTYTPAANYVGSDSFSYTISDGNGGTDTATVTVTVTPVNDPPVANDDSVTTAVDTGKSLNVVANDTDVDGDTLTIQSNTQGAHGTVSCSTPNCTYTPAPGYSGPDSFTYTVSDGHGGTDTATVTVTVSSNPVNNPPVANDDSTSTSEDTPKSGIAVLANDTDADGDTLSITGSTNGTHGTVSCNATTCTYTPAANYFGSDSFTYTISDGNGGTDTATVTVTVTSVNDGPLAVDDSLSTPVNTAGSKNVTTNDTDVDGDSLSVTGKTDGAHGTVSCGPATCTYTPDQDYTGPDSFTYTVSDGHGGTDVGTVTVTVTPVVQTFDVSVTKEPVAASVHVGNLTGYTITVHNSGPATSAPVTLSDPLPAAFKYQKDSSAQCSVVSGTLSCSLGALAPDATVVITVDGAFVAAGSIPNTVTVTAAGDSAAGNNSDTATTQVVGKTCTIVGTFGDDRLLGTNKADVICGLAGNDRINGKQGNDTIYGNEGNDRLNGLGGNDLLDGGPGSDTATYSALLQSVRVNLGLHQATGQGTDTFVSIENVEGSGKDDVLVGDAGANTLSGLGGNDVIKGGAGKDKLLGGAGNDSLNGGGGNDSCGQGTGTGPKSSC